MEEECDGCIAPARTIDDLYNEVIKLLTDQGNIQTVSTHLASLTTNHERALYLLKVVKSLGLLPVVLTNPKSDQVSVYYRCQGNECFKQKNNFEAWQYYNLSLLYAQPSSESFTYAISNRSAVFFELKKYEECLEDLNFLFRSTFPENLGEKLRNRKKRCLSILATRPKNRANDVCNKIIEDFLKVKGPRNEKYICASSKLKVAYTREMGRHVIANENIAVGEIIAQEDPYLVVLLKYQLLFHCAHCLSKTMNLYPCLTCNYTMYCSVACREEAFKAYHQVECHLMVNILAMDFTKLEWLALRTTLKSRFDFGSWYETFKIASDAEGNINTNEWGCIEEGGKWVYNSQHYASVHTLETNVEKRSVSDLFRKSLTAAVMTHFLEVIQFLDISDAHLAAKAKEYVAGTLLHHIMTSPTNMHNIGTLIQNKYDNYIDEYSIASGAYPFLSLLNHSCAPNVVRYSKLGTAQMSLIAIRPIKKGMQIFDNYGSHHALLDRKERQSNLSFQYKFTCTCEACVNDWPIHPKLKPARGVPASVLRKKDQCLSPDVLAKLMKADKKTAIKHYSTLCNLIEVLEPFAPCKELAECQEALKQCLSIFFGMIPHGHNQTVQWRAFPPLKALGELPQRSKCFGHFMAQRQH